MASGFNSGFRVINLKTGEEVKDVVVLKPADDPHARAALWAYARSCEDEDYILASDLRLWVTTLNAADPILPLAQKRQDAGIPDWLWRQVDNESPE